MIIYLDANIVIYAVERDPVWAAKVDRRLAAALSAGDSFALSEATQFECTIAPLRAGDAQTLAKYHRFFHSASVYYSASVKALSVTPSVWARAADFHANYGFQPLDSIHLAAAVGGGCGLFLTADARLARFPDIPVEVIS